MRHLPRVLANTVLEAARRFPALLLTGPANPGKTTLDVRAVTAVRDLATFRRFLALLAARCGSILNKTELAAPLGVSVPTITQWLGVLEALG